MVDENFSRQETEQHGGSRRQAAVKTFGVVRRAVDVIDAGENVIDGLADVVRLVEGILGRVKVITRRRDNQQHERREQNSAAVFYCESQKSSEGISQCEPLNNSEESPVNNCAVKKICGGEAVGRS